MHSAGHAAIHMPSATAAGSVQAGGMRNTLIISGRVPAQDLWQACEGLAFQRHQACFHATVAWEQGSYSSTVPGMSEQS